MFSNHTYNIHQHNINTNDFHQLGEHEKALSMLVHQVRDFSAAEQYCIAQTKGANAAAKSDIFLKLLRIYLRPPPG